MRLGQDSGGGVAVPSLLPGGAPPAVTPGTTKTPLLLPGPAAKPFRSRATPCHEERSLCGRCVAGCRGRAPPRTRVVRRVHEASCQRGPTPRPSRAGEKAKGTARPRMFRRNPHGAGAPPRVRAACSRALRHGAGPEGCTCLSTPSGTASPQHVHMREAPLLASVLGTLTLPNTRAVT